MMEMNNEFGEVGTTRYWSATSYIFYPPEQVVFRHGPFA